MLEGRSFVKLYDHVFESIRRDYEKKGFEITTDVVSHLGSIRRKFESSNFVIPLVPLYIKTILKFYKELKDEVDHPADCIEGNDDVDLLASNSIIGFICRDPILGGHVYHIAKKIYYADYPEISFRDVFKNLNWENLNDIFVLIINNVPLFSSYNDGVAFQKNWEFSSIGSLYSTYLARVLNLDSKKSENLFLSILFKDLGHAVLYNECPFTNTDDKTRCLLEDPEVVINEDLFKTILYHLHPLLAAQVVVKWGIEEADELIEDIIQHHEPLHTLKDASRNLRLHKFINILTNNSLNQMDLTLEKMTKWNDDLRLDIRHFEMEDLLGQIQSVNLTNLDQSLIDPEAATIALTTSYEVLDGSKGGYFVTEENPFFYVNLLQDIKDEMKKIISNYFLNPNEDIDRLLQNVKRINLLQAVYQTEDLQQAADKLGITIEEIEEELEKIRISI